MNAKIVVGVGNIYANEALFKAGIRPTKQAGKVTKNQYFTLAISILYLKIYHFFNSFNGWNNIFFQMFKVVLMCDVLKAGRIQIGTIAI